jgi:rhodanese-related sulfurtransferase
MKLAKSFSLLCCFYCYALVSYSQVLPPDFKTISATEFNMLLRSEKETWLLDVRTPEEFKKGHLAGAININFYDPDFEEKLLALNQNKKYLVYCASGGRSTKTSQTLASSGRLQVYNLEGGITAWVKQGLPVEK